MLGASLEAAGFSVRYVNYADARDREPMWEIAREADAICLRVMTPTASLVAALCAEMRQANRHAYVILGGPHVDALGPAALIENSAADFALQGTAERSLPQLLSCPESPNDVPGCVYRDEDSVLTSRALGSRELVADTAPAYHLLNRAPAEYAHNVMTSRGCPFACDFCVEGASRSTARVPDRAAESVVREMGYLDHVLPAGTLVHISDSVFTLRWERVQELIDLLERQRFSLLYSFDTRADAVTTEQARALQNAGFVYFRLGLETTNDALLERSGKLMCHGDALEASSNIREGADRAAIMGYMMAGLPGSTSLSMAEDAQAIQRMIAEDVVDIIGNKLLVPYPGTSYFEDAAAMGLSIRHRDWSRYDRNSVPVYDLETMTAEQIYQGFVEQEATLAESYRQRVGIEPGDTGGGTLDYSHANYAAVTGGC